MGDVQLGPVTSLSPADVQALWTANGGDPAKALTAAAIVFGAENPAGNAGLVNDTPSTGDYSVGLWQINYAGSLLPMRTAQFGSPEALASDPNAQARAAIAMSQNGSNWQPWGPDFGYSGYSQAVPGPLPNSKVDRWLSAHGGGGRVPWGTVALAAAIVAGAGAAAWHIREHGLTLPRMPRVFDFARSNPTSATAEADPEPMYVQSLLFPTDRYNVPMAKTWARRHGYKSGKVELSSDYIHLVQADPAMFAVIRTIPFGKGIKAHVAR